MSFPLVTFGGDTGFRFVPLFDPVEDEVIYRDNYPIGVIYRNNYPIGVKKTLTKKRP